MSDSPEVRALLCRLFRYKGAEAVSPREETGVAIRVGVGPPVSSPSEAARRLGTSARCGIEVWAAPGRMWLRRDDASVDIDLEAGRAEGQVRPDLLRARAAQRRDPLFHLVALSLALLYRHRGWFPLHAAALARGGRGVLLPARSGQGKTTVTLALLRDGWACGTDDTVLLSEEGDRVQAHSFRRPVCVGPETVERFPELGGPDWPASPSDPAKQAVDVERVYPGRSITACTPRLLVLPEITGAPRSRVEPIGPKPALDRLLAQGAFFLSASPRVADQHLAVLRRLVEQTQTYRFRAGRDVLEEPGTVHEMLAPLVKESPAPDAA